MTTVLLTGASGFLGIHTVQALLAEGHTVRALVRTPARLAEHLRPLGVAPETVDVVAGDMTDAAAVKAAVSGCDAVIHAAATYSFRRRDRHAMLRDNTEGTRLVLEAGLAEGCRSVVHVSSTVALARRGGGVLDDMSPLGPGFGPYSVSKVESERIARTLQESGAPVSIVNPGGVIGPQDPYLGESNEVIVQVLSGTMPLWPRGRLQYVDVRDTAAVLVAAAERAPAGDPTRARYVVPGQAASSLHGVLSEVTGRRLPVLMIPPVIAQAATLPGYLTGWSFLPGAVEGARISACGNAADSTHTTRELGVTARPLTESVADTVRWLVEAGHLSARQAGRLAG